MSPDDIATWCDETLPELYDEGMFDSEEISEEVWEAVNMALEMIEDELTEEDRDELMEAAGDWFKTNHELVLDAITPLSSEAIVALTNKPQTAQHTADWYAERRNRLTASEFSQILDGRRGALLRQKLSNDSQMRSAQAPIGICQSDGEMNATTWGHRFEPITRKIYELEIAGVGTVCDTLGRFTHRSTSWLSASPDGIVVKGPRAGRLVEIKSPKTRQPGEFVPQEYYVQMQIQMEVCNIDVVDFIEAQFTQRQITDISEEDRKALSAATWKGRIEVRGSLEDSSTWVYRYSEPVEDLEDAVIEPIDAPLLESSVWWLMGFYPRTVLRNSDWWDGLGWPNAQLFWAEVQSLRDQGALSPLVTTRPSGGDEEEVIEHIEAWMGST